MIGKRYLGDGAYVDYDGWALVLTTENGVEVTNTVVLEPEVYTALVAYVGELRETLDRKEAATDDEHAD